MKIQIPVATRRFVSLNPITLLLALALGAATAQANNLTWNTTSGIWDIGITPNWSGDATLFTNGDAVTFADTAGGTVTVATDGVLPLSITVGATAGEYIFEGGPIGGSGTLTESGGGTLTLSGLNTYSGKTTVSAGTLNFNTITNVGAASSALGAPTTDADGTIDLATSLAYTGGATASDRIINLTGNGIVYNNGSGLLTLSGGITGVNESITFRGNQTIAETGVIATGSGVLGRTDAGMVTLNNASNSFSGAVGAYAGTISVDSISDGGTPSALGQGTRINFGQTGYTGFGKLQFTGAGGGECDRAITINSPSGTVSGGIIENTVAGQTLTLSGNVSAGGAGPTPQLQLIGAGNGELSGVIYATGLAITMAGTGTWTLSGGNYGSGAMIVNSGVLIFSGGNYGSSATIVNSGMLILSGGNYGSGATTVNSGVLKITNPDALGTVSSGGLVTVNGGQLDLNAISPIVGGISGTSGGLITNSSATPVTLTVSSASSTTYAGSICDGGAANAISIYNSSGVQELTGTNSYSGPTTVAGGALALGTVGAATNSPITVYDGAILGVAVTSAGTTFTPADLTVGSGSGATINCFLGSLGNPTAPVIAPGILAVNGTLTFSVDYDSTGLKVGSFQLLKHSSAASIPTVLGALPRQVVAHLVTNVPNSSIDLVIDSASSAATTWVGNNGPDWDINITVNWTNSVDGLTTYQQIFVPGEPVMFDDTAATSFVNLTTTLSPSAVTVNNSVLNYTFSGPGAIAGPATVTKSGSATLTITTANTYTGGTLISGGTVNVDNGGTSGALGTGSITNNGTLVVNRSDAPTISQLITGTGSLVQGGPGALTLSGANTYTGNTTVGSGTTFGIGIASVTSGTNIISGATGGGSVSLSNGVTLAQSGNLWTVPTLTLQGDITLAGNTRQQVSFRTLDLAGGTRTILMTPTGGNIKQTIPANVALEGTGRNRWETLSTVGALTVTNGNLILDSNLTGNNYAGFMFQNASSFPGNVGLTVGANVFLQTRDSGALGSTTANTPKLTVNGIWSLQAGNGQNQTVYSLAGSGYVYTCMTVANVNPRTLTLNGTADSTDFSGVLANGPGTGALSLVKTGASTQVLSGTNSYTGNTTVNGGTLTLSSSGSLNFVIGASGVNNGIGGTGTVNLNGTFNFDLTRAGTNVGNSWIIVNVGTLTATFGATFNVAGFTYAGDNLWTTTKNGVNYHFSTATGILGVGWLPGIGFVQYTGSNLILSGTNGLPNGGYSVRSSTNVALAAANWPILTNGTFNPQGQFSVTNAVNPAEPQRFYLISQP